MVRIFSTKKAAWLAALAVGLSAALIAPALAAQEPLVLTGSASYVSEESSSKDIYESPVTPLGAVSPPPSLSNEAVKPNTAPPNEPVAKPSLDPVAALTATPKVSTPQPQETSEPTPTQVSAPTQAPVVQQPPTAPVVGTVSVSQVTPENGLGEAVLEWSSIPAATEYRIFKTGTIRPSWRLFYIYPSSITSITIFDQPGSIAIYKIMVVVDSKETLLGEVTYRPTN